MLNPHPMFVHFPIALLSVGLLFDILGLLLKRASLKNAGWWCLIVGVAGAIGAATTGLLAEESVPHSDAVHSIMETHETVGLIAAGTFAALLLWRAFNRGRLPGKTALLRIYILAAVVGVGVMFYGGYLGGVMVFEHGVGGTAVTFKEEHDHGEGHNHGEVQDSELVNGQSDNTESEPRGGYEGGVDDHPHTADDKSGGATKVHNHGGGSAQGC